MAKYIVHSGRSFSAFFESGWFGAALGQHIRNVRAGIPSRLTGEGYEAADGDGSRECSGLTEEEESQLELAESEIESERAK